MNTVWFYAEKESRTGPVDIGTLQRLHASGTLTDETIVWKQGVESGMPLGAVLSLASSAKGHERGLFARLARRTSEIAVVDEIEDVPGQSVLTGGTSEPGLIEDVFAVGTSTTTPPLSQVPAGWPRPRVWWRILFGALATYLLLKLGITRFNNQFFLPGLMVVGSFVVPLSVVVFFFEMNTPRNVSFFQVGMMMMLLGSAVALIATMLLFELVPGHGTGKLVPSLLTGVVEETAKALALLIVLRNVRWHWQLNGLLFGAAVGAGFAGFESAGYAMSSSDLFGSIRWRALLSPGGHVIWTALIGAALWQVRGKGQFDWKMFLHPVVVQRWIVAVVLHGLWDTTLFERLDWLQYLILLVIGWYLVFAVMKRGIAEVAAAKAAGLARAPSVPATAPP
jgi:RsiW-degrading membrane proteinase PrsW (M82 family)